MPDLIRDNSLIGTYSYEDLFKLHFRGLAAYSPFLLVCAKNQKIYLGLDKLSESQMTHIMCSIYRGKCNLK